MFEKFRRTPKPTEGEIAFKELQDLLASRPHSSMELNRLLADHLDYGHRSGRPPTSLECAPLLLGKGASPNIDVCGRPALAHCSMMQRLDHVSALLKAKADPNRGWPIHETIRHGQLNRALIQALLDADSDPFAMDYDQNTLFHVAVKAVVQNRATPADPNLLSFVIALGTPPNTADRYGATPLWTSVGSGQPDVVRIVMGVPGIDLNRVLIVQNRGKEETVLDFAEECHLTDIATMLRKAGALTARELSSGKAAQIALAPVVQKTEQAEISQIIGALNENDMREFLRQAKEKFPGVFNDAACSLTSEDKTKSDNKPPQPASKNTDFSNI